MSRLTTMAPGLVVSGNVPRTHRPNQPGEWQIRADSPSDLDPGDRSFVFGCPRRPGQSCAVLLKPHSYEGAHGCRAWSWDGNTSEPTLTPSINCTDNPPASYGCGWHGFVTKGRFT